MAKEQRKFADDGWAIWIDGEDTSTVYIKDWLNHKGKSYVDLAIRIRGAKLSKGLHVYVPFILTREEIEYIFGEDIEKDDIPIDAVLSQAGRKWEIFHLCLKQGSNMSGYWADDPNKIISEWTDILGERAIPVSDYTKVPQIIVSILEAMAGKSVDEIADSWDGSTAVVVREALAGLKVKDDKNELVEF